MCNGVPILANNKKAVYGKKTNSHTKTCLDLKISEDNFRKYEYHWWDKKLVNDYYDQVGEEIVDKISPEKSRKLAQELVKKHFRTQDQVAKWLKDVPEEWGHLMKPGMERLAKKVNPKLLMYQKSITTFKKTPIEKYNPYQATKLPKIEKLKEFPELAQVRDQVWAQVRAQVWAQVRDQVGATSYWGVKIALNLPIDHWFFNFLKLGVIVVFVKGKVKVFGKGGKYLGEYDESELN